MQNNVKIVDALPNLPSELDIVVLRPSNQVMEDDPRYRSQFRADFRVRRGHVLTWLHYLKVNHPDYRWIKTSPERLPTLPVEMIFLHRFPRGALRYRSSSYGRFAPSEFSVDGPESQCYYDRSQPALGRYFRACSFASRPASAIDSINSPR